MAPNATAQDITINIGANIKSVLSKVNQVKASITQMQSQIQSKLGQRTMRGFTTPLDRFQKSAQNKFQNLQDTFSGGVTKQNFLQGTKKEIQGIGAAVQSTNFRSAGQTLDAINAKTNNIFTASKRAGTGMENLSGKMKQASSEGRGMGQSFDGAALSLMFFGMQLQRIFGGIIRSGVSTFNTVMGQLEDTTTEANRLAGAFTFFKFEVGQAMQPLLGALTPIVAKVGELADRFPGLTRKILTFGAALGGLLIAGGSIRLAQVAFGDLLSRMGGIGPAANSALRGFKNLATFNFSSLGSQLKELTGPAKTLAGIGSITIGASLATEAISDAIEGNFGEAVINGLGAAASTIGGLMLLAGGGAPAAALAAVGLAIQLVGAENIVDAITKTFHVIVSVAKAAAMAIKDNFKDGIINGFKESFNEILDFLAKIGNTVLKALGMGIDQKTMDKAEEAFDRIHGVDDEGKTLTDRFKNNLEGFKERNPELYPDYHASKPDAANADTAQIIGNTLQTPPFQAQGTNQIDLPQGVKDDISTIAEENMKMRKRNEYLNRILNNKDGAFRQGQKYRNMSLPELRQVARGIEETR